MVLMSERLVYTVEELGQVLGIGKNKAYELVSQNNFPSFKVGKKILINKEALSKWVQDQCTIKP
jgi:excisionase family DNA binding protein